MLEDLMSKTKGLASILVSRTKEELLEIILKLSEENPEDRKEVIEQLQSSQ